MTNASKMTSAQILEGWNKAFSASVRVCGSVGRSSLEAKGRATPFPIFTEKHLEALMLSATRRLLAEGPALHSQPLAAACAISHGCTQMFG